MLKNLMDKKQAMVSEHAQCEYSGILGDSEDSDEEPIPEPLLDTSWDKLSILKRLGVGCEEMTEEEAECAFGQFAMAFHCDQYTLTQRLRAEEHDRGVALENLQLELQNTRDTLQMLCECMSNSEVKERVKQMEESLQTMENSMENIISTAETLGASHQEARISRGVELMVLHVENLKKRHSLESMELLHTRRLLQSTRGRLLSDSTVDGDLKQLSGGSHVTRRRVSITLIPTQSQLTDLEVKFLENCRSGEEAGSSNQEELKATNRRCFVLPVDGNVDQSTDGQDEEPSFDGLPSSLQATLRRRGRTPALLKSDQSSEEEESSSPECLHDSTAVHQSETCLSAGQPPRRSSCRRTLMILLLFSGVFIFITLLFLLLNQREPPPRRT
ncbi:inositol 1,4,5-triphosphate receptor associated 2 isoform X1 [Astyanax mexicanus]|uniref:inositol 1,4,5-triphosphate receptor associated 2 isoform X1 n=2 Tax=Astyanax mexicanus TaxID=7994 RepID=UPI0020CA9EAC|nr:inositol 1,4,5-triphosphate receptor associated 2 isoform X1 [Astyanax mexicanus]XP_049327810.1 inositol 1,4,5-triphosphate receptor associated 2 isoform X1 [Astyanax mexicanus]